MKTPLIVAVLILVIVGAGVLMVMGFKGKEGGALRKAQASDITVINVKTLDLKGMTFGEWESKLKFDADTGYRKDGAGNVYSVITKCAACTQDIPAYPIAESLRGEREEEQIKRDYKCPKCMKPALPVLEKR
jgi:hypothetical protein